MDGYGHESYLRGPSVPLQVGPLGASSQKLANGPLVFTGASLNNTGAAATTVTFTDGSGETVLLVTVPATSVVNPVVPDQGVAVSTELDVASSAAGPVSGCVFVRQPDDYIRTVERFREKSAPTQSPSPPARP